jgi:glucokinase
MTTAHKATTTPGQNILAGDIGGTNVRLALVALDENGARIQHARTYESRRYAGLGAAVHEFLSEVPERPAQARYAVAGPVESGVAHLPNLDWVVDTAALAMETGIADTQLLNDFSAVGYAVPLLGANDLVELQAGQPAPRSPIAILGAGTGLGQGFLVWAGEGYCVCDSEGGHADFAPRDATECAFRAWLQDHYGHASWERVLSGSGLVNLYHFLAESNDAQERPDVQAAMSKGDPAAVIAQHGLAGDDPLCTRALSMFVSAYGAQAGNIALMLQAGAVYLAGGIAPKILAALRGPGFRAAFRDKGRFTTMMDTMAIHVIVNPHVGLIGAAASARTGGLASGS